MLLALLNPLELQGQQLAPSKTTPEQHPQHRVIAEFARGGRRPPRQQSPSLLGREPVSQPNAETSHALDAPNAGCQFGTEQPGIGRLVGHAAHRGESQVDRGRGVAALLEVNPVAEHDRAVERETRLRAIPGDKLPNGMVVRALAAG